MPCRLVCRLGLAVFFDVRNILSCRCQKSLLLRCFHECLLLRCRCRKSRLLYCRCGGPSMRGVDMPSMPCRLGLAVLFDVRNILSCRCQKSLLLRCFHECLLLRCRCRKSRLLYWGVDMPSMPCRLVCRLGLAPC